MKVQRVEVYVCPMATPADTKGLQELADSGKIKPDTLVARWEKPKAPASTMMGARVGRRCAARVDRGSAAIRRISRASS